MYAIIMFMMVTLRIMVTKQIIVVMAASIHMMVVCDVNCGDIGRDADIDGVICESGNAYDNDFVMLHTVIIVIVVMLTVLATNMRTTLLM